MTCPGLDSSRREVTAAWFPAAKRLTAAAGRPALGRVVARAVVGAAPGTR
jgi:hypothetical protein